MTLKAKFFVACKKSLAFIRKLGVASNRFRD